MYNNYFLWIASQSFPSEIDIIADSGNDSRGEHELIVVDKDGLIGSFYYESKSDRDNDVSKLEMEFRISDF